MKVLDLPGLKRFNTKINALIDKRIEKAMISHVLDSTNTSMVLGADVGPKVTQLINNVNTRVDRVNSDLAIVGNVNGMEFGTDGEKRYFVFKHNDGSKSSLEFYNNGVNLVRYNPKTAQWEIIWSIPVTVN